MGYVNLTNLKQFIPASAITKTAGTWTPAVASNVISEARTAAAASFDLLIPLALPGAAAYRQAVKLKTVKLHYQVGTAAASDFATVALHKMTLGATVTGEALTITLDADHDTAAERKAVAVHEMTVTLPDDCWVKEDEALYLQCTISAAGTTVFTLFGAVLGFELNL